MKHVSMLLCLATAMVFISCKKDKDAPRFDGTPNAISGNWQMNLVAITLVPDAIVPQYAFGTDFKYEKKGGKQSAPVTERGTYSMAESTGGYTLTLKPAGGESYKVIVTELKANDAVFKDSKAYAAHPYIRK